MGPLVLLAAAGLLWAWATGRLRRLSHEDVVAALLFLLGIEMLAKGVLLPGAALMASSLLWAAWRRKPRSTHSPAMPADEARRLLGLPERASLAEIREAHRRLIARVHPDTGGSAELATRVNAARDSLVAELNRRPPRAS
jgi:DnaJ family protein C protein 19